MIFEKYSNRRIYVITDLIDNKHVYIDQLILDMMMEDLDSELTNTTKSSIKRIKVKHKYFWQKQRFSEIMENGHTEKVTDFDKKFTTKVTSDDDKLEQIRIYNFKLKCLKYIHMLENLYGVNLVYNVVSDELKNNVIKLIKSIKALAKHAKKYFHNNDYSKRITSEITDVYCNITSLMEEEGYTDEEMISTRIGYSYDNPKITDIIEYIIKILYKRFTSKSSA